MEKRNNIHLENLLNKFVVQFLAAAIVDPGQHSISVETPTGTRAEEARRSVSTEPVGSHTVTSIQCATTDSLDQFKGRNNRS
jgi:hypothetical protein